MKYQKITYSDLNAKQQERYNYQKFAAVLADYGFITMLLSDDWNGADFLAVHKDGDVLKVQLKGRMTFQRRYVGKDLYICFRSNSDWYLYPHDELLEKIDPEKKLSQTDSWINEGKYSFPNVSEKHLALLDHYKIVKVG